MQCSDDQLKAIAGLKDDHNFRVFMNCLVEWAEIEVKECITAEKPKMNQGRAQVLTDIIETVDKANEHYRGRIARKAVAGQRKDNAF